MPLKQQLARRLTVEIETPDGIVTRVTWEQRAKVDGEPDPAVLTGLMKLDVDAKLPDPVFGSMTERVESAGRTARLRLEVDSHPDFTVERWRATDALQAYTVAAENSDYDEYDEWCVPARSEDEALELVRNHRTFLAHYVLSIESVQPVGPGVPYSSFHPG